MPAARGRASLCAAISVGTPHYFVAIGDHPAAELFIVSPPHDGSDQVFLDHRG